MRSPIRKLIILLLLSAGAAHSAEWKIDPTISFKAGYNDNIRLNIDDKISSAEATLSPGAVFSGETPTSGLSGDLRFDFRRFEDDSNLDDNNVRFNMNSFRSMERSRVGLNLGLIKDTTLDTQLEETGLAFERLRRSQISGGPEWSYTLNNRTSLSSSYNYTDVQYKNAAESGFVDYNIQRGQVALNRTLSERSSASITLSHSRSDNDNDVKSNNSNLDGGASYQFSETLSASLFAGVRYTETDFSQSTLIPIFSGDIIIGFIPLTQDVSNSSSGFTFSGSLSKRFLRGKTDLTASRNISNSTNGVPVEVTRLNWINTYNLTEILIASLKIQFYKSEAENSAAGGLNRNYYTIEPNLRWDFKKFWSIFGTYRYRKQTFDNTSDDATQNAAYLTLTYRWPRIAVSR